MSSWAFFQVLRAFVPSPVYAYLFEDASRDSQRKTTSPSGKPRRMKLYNTVTNSLVRGLVAKQEIV